MLGCTEVSPVSDGSYSSCTAYRVVSKRVRCYEATVRLHTHHTHSTYNTLTTDTLTTDTLTTDTLTTDTLTTAAGGNNLPLHLYDFELSLSEFRRLLKTHLFG